MSCLAGILPILIWLIVVIAVVAIVRIIVGYLAAPPIAVQIANVVMWAVAAIACLYVVFQLLSCAVPFK